MTQVAQKQVKDLENLKSTVTNLSVDSGWKTLYNADGRKCFYRKVGSIVTVIGSIVNKETAHQWSFGTLPTGYRPYDTMLVRNGHDNAAGALQVGSNGLVRMYSASGSTIWWLAAVATYIAA